MSEADPHGRNKNDFLKPRDGDAHQRAELEAEYTYKSAELRRKAIGLISRYLGDKTVSSWVHYSLPSKAAPGIPAEYNTDRRILLFTYQGKSHKLQTVRILTNELFGTLDQGNLLTEDFILDHKNDAQYFIDAALIKEHTPQKPTKSPIFVPNGDKLMLTNCQVFPPRPIIETSDSGNGFVLPFGDHRNISDKLDALNYGSDLFAEIAAADPDSWSSTD